MRHERTRAPYDWDRWEDRPVEPRSGPPVQIEPNAEFWRGFAYGVPVALALWLLAALLTLLLFWSVG